MVFWQSLDVPRGTTGVRGNVQVVVFRSLALRRMTFRRSQSVCHGLARQGEEFRKSPLTFFAFST